MLNCVSCNSCLSGPDGPRPAETYGGTYTGLCYACERGPRMIVGRWACGAVKWSYPPSCPSWRRDREEYVGYSDCKKCNGDGCKWISRSDGDGGSYRAYCSDCSKRWHEYPARTIRTKLNNAINNWIKKASKPMANMNPVFVEHYKDYILPKVYRRYLTGERWVRRYDSRHPGTFGAI